MKRYFCLIGAMLAAAATPTLASEANPSAPTTPAAAQRTADHQAMPQQVRQGLAQLRETLEARKREAKQRATAAQHETEGLCSDCPEKDAKAHHHSVSEERKADCPECISQAIYA
jgi:septal ring-binding cell division protein DamX